MKLDIVRLFPTSVFIFDNVLEPEYIDSMREDIIYSSKLNTEKRKNNWQSQNSNKLYELPKYKELGRKALSNSKIYIDKLEFIVEDINLTGMWSNVLKNGETHPPHTHSNNFISGVFYVQAEDDSSTPAINFLDPRGQSSILAPNVETYTIYNSTRYFFPAVVNRMILFPSWLQHFVPVNSSKVDRISIAFNLMLKGKVGEPADFQSANF